jgi:hypothetical protein
MWNLVQRLHKKKCKKTGRTQPNQVDREIIRRQEMNRNAPGGLAIAKPTEVGKVMTKYEGFDKYLEERGMETDEFGWVYEPKTEVVVTGEDNTKKCECDDWIWKCEKCINKLDSEDSE